LIPPLSLVLPVGISFYTFRNLSYLLDVYQGKIKAEKHLGLFAVYVAFWPLLLAGPIERASHLMPQLYSKVSLNYDRVVSGFRLMLWGYFKKVAIANQLAFYVNGVYTHPSQYGGNHCFLATLFFTFQIYCDFSGYSDIAVGASKVMGFDIINNFDRPYFSKSISEFWRRWHISLSTWFRDYVYIPLGGRRVARGRWYCNLMITFLLVGLWHGASWTFVAWGALHGFYMILGSVTSEWRRKLFAVVGLSQGDMLRKAIQICATFMFVCVGWVFFRANSLQDALFILKKSLTDLHLHRGIPIIPGFGEVEVFYCIFLIGIMELFHLLTRKVSIDEFMLQRNVVTRWGIYLFFLMAIILFSYTEDYQFIYVQF
jgi:D-alanyl-lipoteichoic acid acyltransferase DltB (MBOAT superfamily)